MKKLAILFLMCLCLSFNVTSAYASPQGTLKQGIYRPIDFDPIFDPAVNRVINVRNISPNENINIIIFDENQREIAFRILDPNSKEYELFPELFPLKKDYTIALIGKGELAITLSQPK